jgi:uncharacterized protein (TIGR03000 family)
MFRNRFVIARGMALALLALLVTAGVSHAQPAGPQGMGWISGGSQGSSYGGGGYGGASYAAPSYYSAPGAYYAPAAGTPVGTGYQSFYYAPQQAGTTGYQSFYPPQPGSDSFGTLANRNRNVRVNVTLPANAQISFDGTNAGQATGTFRQFTSPPIAAGQDYAYDVKVSWMQDGKEMTQTRHVVVHSGDVINLTFGPAASNQAAADTNANRNNQ